MTANGSLPISWTKEIQSKVKDLNVEDKTNDDRREYPCSF